MTTQPATFGISLGAMFRAGISGFRRNVVPLLLAGSATVAAYLAFRLPAQSAAARDDILISLALDLFGLVTASVVAYPWFSYALTAASGEPVDLGAPFRRYDLFTTQAVASFWFWAGMLLGLRYLFGIPSVLALLFYAFYGYVVADGVTDSGLKALGHSARIGEGRRVALFAVGGLLLVFNLFGAMAIGFGVNPLTIVLAFLGFVITASITLVAGGAIYRALLALNSGET